MEFHLFLPQMRLSGGRFELGLGWGSWDGEFSMFGVGPATSPARVRRMRETLEVLRALWTGETVDYHGEFHQLSRARQAPGPLGRIPVVIGGAGPATLALVREFADWWNAQVTQLHRLEQARPPGSGGIRALSRSARRFRPRPRTRPDDGVGLRVPWRGPRRAGKSRRRRGRLQPRSGNRPQLSLGVNVAARCPAEPAGTR